MSEEQWQHRFVQTNGIRMHFVEQGKGYPVLFIHGYPELWYSWRSQIPALAQAGFHAIAPDMRGYGETDKPPRIEDYAIQKLVGDIVGLLDALKIEKTVIVGHDWGGIIVWQVALMAPERIERVISLNTPYRGRGQARPTDVYKKVSDGRFNYILHYQEPGLAESEIMPDVRKWLSSTIRRIAKRQEFLTEEVLDIFTSAYQKGGITGPINYYRNIDRNWETTPQLAGKQVMQKSLIIMAENDPILIPQSADGMEKIVPNLTKKYIKNCGHWTQQEQPEQVNKMIIEWLKDDSRGTD
jgi:pimeloyl-ACP methyl ester carboxylesterase